MDSLTDKEFHSLFRRVSHTVNLKGCSSRDEVDDRIKGKIDAFKRRRKEMRERGVFSKALNNAIVQLKKVLHHGFGERTIDEAVARPRGLEGLTLRFGAGKAKEILLHRKHLRQRMERHTVRNRRTLR